MRGYTLLITTRTINDYIDGCLQLFLKNNWKIIFIFTIFNYFCCCDNNPNINMNNNYVEMVKSNKSNKRRVRPLAGNSGYTKGKPHSEFGGLYERVVDGVHYRDRVKSGVR